MSQERSNASGASDSSRGQQVLHADSHPSSRVHLRATPATRLEIWATRIPDFYITPFCGAAAGVASGIVTCPLDVIKTKLQAQGGFVRRGGKLVEPSNLYRGLIGTGRMIWREEGLRGLYRGLGPMLLGYLPTWAVYLTVYDRSREFFFDKTENWWLSRGYASVTAGACSTVVTNPIWVIKTRLMSQRMGNSTDGYRAPWQYRNTLDAARKMYRNEGIRSFYSGLTPALLGLTHVAIQFPLYEYLKTAFTGYSIGEHPDEGSSHWVGISLATFLSKTQQRAAPASSPEEITFRGGLHHPEDRGRPPGASSSDGMPNRPRYQGVIRTCKTILREEGWHAFYSGIGTNLVRAVPAAMTTMLTYEYLRKQIHNARYEGERKLEMIEKGEGDAVL